MDALKQFVTSLYTNAKGNSYASTGRTFAVPGKERIFEIISLLQNKFGYNRRHVAEFLSYHTQKKFVSGNVSNLICNNQFDSHKGYSINHIIKMLWQLNNITEIITSEGNVTPVKLKRGSNKIRTAIIKQEADNKLANDTRVVVCEILKKENNKLHSNLVRNVKVKNNLKQELKDKDCEIRMLKLQLWLINNNMTAEQLLEAIE